MDAAIEVHRLSDDRVIEELVDFLLQVDIGLEPRGGWVSPSRSPRWALGSSDGRSTPEVVCSLSQGGEASANDAIAVLNLFGVNDIEMPVTLRKTVFNADGTITTSESEDRLSVEKLQRFVPVDSLSVTKL